MVFPWVPNRDLADLRAPGSGDGGGLRVDQPTMKTPGVIGKPSAGGHTASMAATGDMGLSMARSRNHVPDSVKAMGHGVDGGPVMGSIVGHSVPAPETSRLDGRAKGMLEETYDFDYMGHPITAPAKGVGYDANDGRSLGSMAGDLQEDAPLNSNPGHSWINVFHSR